MRLWHLMAAVTVIMIVVMVMLTIGSRCHGNRCDACVFLELLQSSTVNRSGISTSSLHASMRQQFEDGLQILFGSFRRARKSQNERLIAYASDRSRH